MRSMLTLASVALVSGCITSDKAAKYAARSHPECSEFRTVNYTYASEKAHIQAEVSMTCDGVRRSISVKCDPGGFGCDYGRPVCHENN